jgi:DNA-directed RNA polymerase specialized sigma24 family protein
LKERLTLAMTLPEALALLAPSDSTLPPDEGLRRDEAIERIWRELDRLARAIVHVPGIEPQDVSSMLLVRLMRLGPGRRGREVATEGEAQAFLRCCIKNQVRDILRKRGRRPQEVSMHPDEDGFGGYEAVDPLTAEDILMEQHDEAMALQYLTEATRLLYEEAIPVIAGKLQNAQGFRESVEDLRAIARGHVTMEDIVRREGGVDGTFERVRNRVYQRHKRTRAYLLDVPTNRPTNLPRLTEWLRDAALDPKLDAAVRIVAQRDFAPRVVHGGKPGTGDTAS